MNQKPSKELGVNSGAYVLHALSDAENVQFESLLAESEETRAEVTELADTAVELGLSVAPVDPPAALRASILDKIAVTPQLAPLSTPLVAVDASRDDEEHEIARPAAPAPVGPAEERARRRWYARPAATLIAAAAAVALIFGGGVAVTTALQGQQTSATASAISQIKAASDYRQRTVTVTNGGKATVIWSESLRQSALLGTGLAKLSDGKTYELWYMRTSGAVPAGTFTSDSSGTKSVVLTGKMNNGDTIGMSIEPAGGSQKPTGNPVVIVTTA